eukprot:CAMPEP_0177622878 /NCGR_PEP_ID=MMETSP0419_2-20121207/28586_1 /TAXON_ID=582737 /ORGANISM="Tetraselmis sp., Strain GSL018" /LENGTH=30 /DNA_ID= /DNA_START= /DNA_END= /DNA_ORIENTATION=
MAQTAGLESICSTEGARRPSPSSAEEPACE